MHSLQVPVVLYAQHRACSYSIGQRLNASTDTVNCAEPPRALPPVGTASSKHSVSLEGQSAWSVIRGSAKIGKAPL